ncbi:unnamed protein product [Arabidopsis thaliana]|uniref:(thale cress) hypothetical protein n=1 Tax=Arabidopsis thaliana TaxID=3702 RepID=A0A7G2EUY0_ARATH|nr:unnamed protein product [Arabidopsis thaliana]
MGSRGNVAEDKNVSSKAIRKKVNNTVSIALKRYKIDSYILLDLDKVLNDVYCSFRPVSADYDTRKELVKNLNTMALDIYGKSEESSPVLEAYGSFVMDMYSSQSDLDVSINFGNGTSEIPREKKLEILKRFAKKLRSLQGEGQVKNVESIFSAKIVRIISQIDGRFQKLCLLVKHWAKAHEVNSALHRTLNSVSITLLVALHLQTQNPPILPPFSMLFKDGMDPSNVEKKAQKFLNWGQRNQESLGRLFATFFIKLQSVEFLWRQGLCVSVLNGLWISKKWKKVGVGSISVEDFTNVSQNVARRVNGAGAKRIYSSINRTVEDIFEFLNDKVVGTDLRHSGSIAETHFRHRSFPQEAVLDPRPPVQSRNVYSQQLHHNYRNGFSGPPEEHYNKRLCLGNRYRALEETGNWREEERYEDPRGKRSRQVHLNAGTNGHLVHQRHDGRYSGEEPMHVGQWQDYTRRVGSPPPQQPPPPYDRVSYEDFRPHLGRSFYH